MAITRAGTSVVYVTKNERGEMVGRAAQLVTDSSSSGLDTADLVWASTPEDAASAPGPCEQLAQGVSNVSALGADPAQYKSGWWQAQTNAPYT